MTIIINDDTFYPREKYLYVCKFSYSYDKFDNYRMTLLVKFEYGPMDKRELRIQGLTGKDRKKEQNRLASRRFRVRRKMEMSTNEVQVAVLEKRNVKLRSICDDYTKKIGVIKDVLEKLRCQVPSSSSFLLTDSSNSYSEDEITHHSTTKPSIRDQVRV